jgi:hypothetical protein
MSSLNTSGFFSVADNMLYFDIQSVAGAGINQSLQIGSTARNQNRRFKHDLHWSRRRPADPGWVSAGPSGHTGCPQGKEYGREAVARERSSLDQMGRAHYLMQSSEDAFRRRREQGSETP